MPSRPKRSGRHFRRKHRPAPPRTAEQSKRGRRNKPPAAPPPIDPAADSPAMTCAQCRPELYPYPTCSRD